MKICRSDSFKEAFKKLDVRLKKKVEKALRLFCRDPYHPSLHTKKMQGVNNIWEVRVDIHYRFTFDIVDDVYRLRNLDNHDECLNNP
ncbi:MAG: hypothetical protein ABRQ38_30955 [Candidatus Eremiobacterota bacterium]